MKRWTAALLSVLLMLALFGCGNDSFLVSQALSPSELPDIVLPDQIENNGSQHLLRGSSLLLEEPRYSEEIGPEDFVKVFGQETLAWAGWSPDEVWGRYCSAGFGQNGEAYVASATLTKARPNTDDDVRVRSGGDGERDDFGGVFPETGSGDRTGELPGNSGLVQKPGR